MTSRKIEQPRQIRPIYRAKLQQSLAMTATLALLVAGCGTASDSTATVNEQNANEEVQAVFYENTEQCEADAQKQQEEYAVLLKAHQTGTLTEAPTPPVMKAEDCEAQMLAAQQEHQRHAPQYATLAECQADGVQCETTANGTGTTYYRPAFGGSYFYPYDDPDFIYVNYGGTRHRVYQPRTVYQSNTPGQVVTPYGRTVSQTSSGLVTAPRHTTVAAPQRPTGTAAQGTIKGRSSQGFGSTFKSTGSGGK